MRKAILAVGVCALACTAAPAQATYGAGTTGVETAFMALHSSRCLDNAGSTSDQTAVIQWHCNGLNYQQWRFISTSGNSIQIRNAHSGKCLDVPGNTASGTVLVQHQCHGGVNQQWVLVPGNAGGVFGSVKIVSVYSNKCVDVFGHNLNDGAAVVQWDCVVGNRNQDWILQ